MAATPPARKMEYVRLGKSGLKISKIVLGCMSYGSKDWQGWVLGEKESIEHIKFAYENGIQTFDTANAYSNGESERILGKAIKQLQLPRDEIVVMTKVYFLVTRSFGENYMGKPQAAESAGYVNQQGLSRKHIFDSVKHSLERLQLDYIDVLQCHRFDQNTPIEETMQALHDVVKAGWVRYVGMSSCYAWQFQLMQNYAIQHNLTPFISMQNHYSLLYREEEREMMPTLKHFGVGSIPWSPLARGKLTRPLGGSGAKTTREETDPWISLYGESESSKEVIRRVEAMSKKHGASMAQISLAWTLAKDPVAAPIVGMTSLDKLKDLLGTLDVKLSTEDIQELESPYVAMPISGH